MEEKMEEQKKPILLRKIKIKWWMAILFSFAFGAIIIFLEVLLIK